MKPEGSAVLVTYIIICAMAASCMLLGWCAHSWNVEDKLVLCKAYEKINKADKKLNTN